MIKFAYFCAATSRINANSRNIVVLDNNETAVTEVIDPKEERDGEEEKGGQLYLDYSQLSSCGGQSGIGLKYTLRRTAVS